METLFTYILKASSVIVLFYLVYEFFLKRETFFLVNRIFLLTGLVLALIVPLVVIERVVEVEALSFGSDNMTAVTTVSATQSAPLFQWQDGLLLLFIAGVALMLSRMIVQLLSVGKIIRRGRTVELNNYKLVEMQEEATPFSFFKYIFYNPGKYGNEELEAILEHEKVHCRQWHSLDVLLAQFLLVVLWFNPLSWLYLRAVQQNLEFLADASATRKVVSKKAYQYTMLKVSGQIQAIPVTNNFYNSLIKKRIVMLHQSKSKNRNLLKTFIVLPFLAMFLWGFNVKTVYLPVNDLFQVSKSEQEVNIRIDKDTSDQELEDLKKDLSDKGIDFSYTVVHNENKEIIDLNISISSLKDGKNTFTGTSSFNNDGEPIDPVNIVFDKDNNFFFTNGHDKHQRIVHTDSHVSTVIHADGDEHQSIEIYKNDGKEVIKVNGKEVTRKEFKKMKKDGKIKGKHIMINSHDSGDSNHHIMIMGDGEHEDDVEIINVDEGGFLFLNGEFDEDWYVLLDGKEVPFSMVRDLDPDDVRSINVIKGEEAVKKYGKKAKNGVLRITTQD